MENCDLFMEPSPCSDQIFRLLSTEYPIYLAERHNRWDLGRRLAAAIDWSVFGTFETIKDEYKELPDGRTGPLADIRICVAPCKRQISTAISVCYNILMHYNIIDCYIRVDDRLSASCCSRSATSERLELLLSELKEGNYSGSQAFNQERLESIDRLWLEQRLYEIDGDTDRDLISPETHFPDHLRGVYDCTGLTKPLAAILLIGESSLINKVMNTHPFHASPRVPKPNEFFGTDRHWVAEAQEGYRYTRKFLGSFDVNRDHKKAQAPSTLLVPSLAASARSFLKRRGSKTGSDGLDSHAKRVNNTQSEPESEDASTQSVPFP